MRSREKEPRRNLPIPIGWWVFLFVGLLILPGVVLADRRLMAALQPQGAPWLVGLLGWGTWLGYGLVDIAVPLSIGLIGRARGDAETWRRGFRGGLAVTLAGLLDQVAKNLVCRSRPGATDAGAFFAGFPCFPVSYALASFPSGHATTAFALATLLSLWHPRWAAAWFALAALVGWSRIVLGSHFPSDVLGGAVLGSAVVIVLSRLWPRLMRGPGERRMGQ